MKQKTAVIDPKVEFQYQLDQLPTIDFGISYITEYREHGAHGAHDVIWIPTSNCFVSYNERQIHVWNAFTGERNFEV
jgi:hypothetical protein